MTQEQLLKLFYYCKSKYNGSGEDVFQEACFLALKRYKSLSNVNQTLFKLLCREAARRILKHKKYEITFSEIQLQCHSGNNEEDDFENLIVDPRSLDACNDAYDDDFISFANKKQLQEKSFQLQLF